VTGTYSNGSKGTPAVTWKATGGSISNAGWYTAGNTAGAFLVIASCACGVADTAAISLSASDLVGISITPTSADLKTGEQFTFVAQGWVQGSNTPVTPSVTWSATGGSVTQGGVYTAGSTAGTFYVKAVSNTGSPKDSATVNIASAVAPPPAPTLKNIELTPASVTLLPGDVQAFQALGRMTDGSTIPVSVTYSQTGGTMSGSTYTAGSQSGTYRVIATEAGGKADTSLVTIQLVTPPPPGGTDYPNEPAGFSRVAEHDFNAEPFSGTATAGSWWDFPAGRDPDGGWMVAVTDNTAPVGDDKVLRTKFPKGMVGGTAPGNVGAQWSDLSSVYVTFWYKMEGVSGLWEGNPTAINKWGWLGSAYGTTGNMQTLALMGSGLRSWFTVQMRQQGPVSGARNILQNVPPYAVVESPTQAQGIATVGSWHQIEYLATLNTIGQQDGILKIWIDGRLTHDYANIRWRDAANPRGFYSWKWEPTYGGGGDKTLQDDYALLAKVYISGKPLL